MSMRDDVRGLVPWVTECRREIHRHPEVSGEERETSARIRRELEALDIGVRTFGGCHSLMGVLGNGDGPCVAVRAELDALPIREETGLPFASENPGVMHACGHDVHMALALGSARWFAENRDRWRGTVKFFFESEEETVGGGQRMTAQGCMENPHVDCIVGQHVNPNHPVNSFYARSGAVSGASDELTLTVRGASCHGAYPEKGTDAIVIAAQIVSALQTLVSRTVSPFDPVALTFGTVRGGTAGNIVCGEVVLTGTLRTIRPETRAALNAKLRQVSEGIAAAMGGSAVMDIRRSYGEVVNDPVRYALVEELARALVGDGLMVPQAAPSLGVESFSFFLEHTPGVYYDLGCGVGTGLHTPTFRVDEAVLETGLALQVAAVRRLLAFEQAGV